MGLRVRAALGDRCSRKPAFWCACSSELIPVRSSVGSRGAGTAAGVDWLRNHSRVCARSQPLIAAAASHPSTSVENSLSRHALRCCGVLRCRSGIVTRDCRGGNLQTPCSSAHALHTKHTNNRTNEQTNKTQTHTHTTHTRAKQIPRLTTRCRYDVSKAHQAVKPTLPVYTFSSTDRGL